MECMSNVDFKPREYQVEMLETAIKRNTILFMPTGSGKTFIAAMLIKHLSKNIEKPYNDGGQRTFFLVNTVALVTQQADSIARMLPLQVSTYSGDMGVDYWDQRRWGNELEKNQVLVMTAQIFLNLLLHHYINMNKVNLLIMDECHHTMRNHAMNQIMKIYHEIENEGRPRILGLTATLLNANCKLNRIEQEIKALEANMDSKVITATDEDLVQKYSTNPKEVVLTYSPNSNSNAGSDLLNECLRSLEATINCVNIEECPINHPIIGAELLTDNKKPIKKRLINCLEDIKVHYDDLGLFAAAECALAVVVRLERMKLSTTDSLLPSLLEVITTKLHYFRNRAFGLMKGTEMNWPLTYSTPKLLKLFEILRGFKSDAIAIVFVERRLTAKVLFYIISRLSKSHSFSGIRADFIVGFNNNPFNDTREVIYLKKSNMNTLRKFNLKETNVLFASNVIEEGIDIRTCNYVIKFDLPSTFRSYIQSKGRARHKDSTFILLMPEGSKSQGIINYNLFKRMEEYMKENLCGGRAVSHLKNKESSDIPDCDFPPYYVDGPNSAKVTALSAIPLINRYCMSLPQDRLCPLTCYWWVQEVKVGISSKFTGILQLPINSPIKTYITGPLCDTKINAKRTVALEACKRLHQIGELDSNLLPYGTYSELLNDENLFPHWDPNEPRAGSKNIRRSYDKHYSSWEYECRPNAGTDLYIHFIKITPNYERPDKSRLAAFYDILKSKSSFSILSSKKWPKICSFTMFMNVGEVKIEILENVKIVRLTTKQIDSLFAFHCLLFTEVLSVTKVFVMRDYDNLENSYFIVPTIEGENSEITIDWETIKEHRELVEIKKLSNDSRKNIVVNEKTYLGKVVVPWYRSKGYAMRYIVTKVCQDESPDSPFPSANYDSYAHYFKDRYNQELLNPTQPLIEVRAISSKINCLLPRGKRQSSRRRNRHEEDDFEETLIPELCCLVEFPAVYMLKTTLLPSILHRIHYLLIAEELRQKIAKETDLGINNTSDVIWEPLRVDTTALHCDDKQEVRSTIEVSDLLTSNMNALKEGIFPWKEEDEPFDIERLLFEVDLLAIIHYQRFMSKMVEHKKSLVITESIINSDKQCRKSEPPLAPLFILNKDLKENIGPQQSTILQALTAASASDIVNYERLETLGDSFLKFIVSLSLFTNYQDKDEGKLTQVKGKVIGNKNFFFVGRNINLGKLLKVHDFSPSDWEVPCFTLSRDFKNIIKDLRISPAAIYQICLTPLERDSGILREETRLKVHELIEEAQERDEGNHTSWTIVGQHTVPDKTVADAVEALVGAYLQACGIKGALILTRWLGILAPEISDINELLVDPAPSSRLDPFRSVDFFLVEPDRLEEKLGYKFKDRSFLLQALTHASFQNNVTDCYQRLEFLGDAILDFLITVHIYENCGNLSPGQLTDLRSALVNNVTFACISVRYGFHKHLNARASKLNDIITRFVQHQESRDHKIGAEVLFLIEEENARVAESIDVPKILGDIIESLAAAIYLDSGKDLQQVWNVFYNLMKKEIDEFSKTVPKNHIRLLYEKFPSPVPKFGSPKIIENDGRVLIPLEVVHNGKPIPFHGIGENKCNAKLAAAKLALRFFHKKYQDIH